MAANNLAQLNKEQQMAPREKAGEAGSAVQSAGLAQSISLPTNKCSEQSVDGEPMFNGSPAARKTAAVMHARNLRIQPVSKEAQPKDETADAGKADALRVTFDLEDDGMNSGSDEELYIRVVGPNGSLLNETSDPVETLVRHDGTAISYSARKELTRFQCQELKNVSIDVDNNNGNLAKGNYHIEIYNDGYKVGMGTVMLP